MKTKTAKRSLSGKRRKDEGLLTSVAESIGSTIGTIVGRANSAQKALTENRGTRGVKLLGKAVRRRAKTQR